jgi:hypothetical protein
VNPEHEMSARERERPHQNVARMSAAKSGAGVAAGTITPAFSPLNPGYVAHPFEDLPDIVEC